MLNITEWVVTHGVHPGQVISLILYLLPGIILFALPASILMAVLIAFLRLSSDNEIIALKSSGISLYQMLPPVFAVSIMGSIIAAFLALFASPWGNNSFKDLIFKVVETGANVGIKERVFWEPFNDVVFYINTFSSKERFMRDIFVADKRDPSVTNTIIAKEGRIFWHSKERMVTIFFKDGTIFVVDRDFRTVRTVKFKTYNLNIGLDDIMPAISSRKKSPKEMFVQELIDNLDRIPKGEIRYNEMMIELMEMFSIPIAVFFMGIIGVPLGAQVRSSGRLTGIIMGLGVFLIYYFSLAGARSVGETGTLSPVYGTWLPNLFLLIASIYLFHRAASERSINVLERFTRKWKVKGGNG